MTPLFNGSNSPQLFGTPLGADFPRALVDALRAAYADAPPEALYPEGKGAFEFERTASRLSEMQSADWVEMDAA